MEGSTFDFKKAADEYPMSAQRITQEEADHDIEIFQNLMVHRGSLKKLLAEAYVVGIVVILITLVVLVTTYLPYRLILYVLPEFLHPAVHAGILIAFVNYVLHVVRPINDTPGDNAPAESRRVAIIGGGLSGFVTAKELLEEGHEPIIFEKNGVAGGVWAMGAGPGVWSNTMSSSSIINTAFSDFPMRPVILETNEPMHIPQHRYIQYLHEYIEHFNLAQYVRYNSDVTDMQFDEIRRTWTVTVNGQVDETDYDWVTICSGAHQEPVLPDYPGIERFQGKIKHSSSFQDPTEFAGKRVVCVGAGESASDIIYDLAKQTEECYVSIRNPVIILPRNWFGVSPEEVETRSLYYGPRWLRYIVLLGSQIVGFPFLHLFNRMDITGKIKHLPKADTFMHFLLTKEFFQNLSLTAFVAGKLVTKTENMLYAIESGDAVAKPAITEFTETGVVFEDGTVVEADEVFFITGYKEYFPFLREDLQEQDPKDRYLLMFHPELQNCGFVGFCRGQVGSLTSGAEMQARALALVISGKRQVQEGDDLRQLIETDRKTNKDRLSNLGSFFYCQYLARHFVNCEPHVLSVFLRSPLVWWRMMTHNCAPLQYRFRGPHSNPKIAFEGYMKNPTCVFPLNNVINMYIVALAPVFHYYSKLPFIGHHFRPLLDQWY
jgi:dimethylaniline monooxygenase (N-oxide forming)